LFGTAIKDMFKDSKRKLTSMVSPRHEMTVQYPPEQVLSQEDLQKSARMVHVPSFGSPRMAKGAMTERVKTTPQTIDTRVSQMQSGLNASMQNFNGTFTPSMYGTPSKSARKPVKSETSSEHSLDDVIEVKHSRTTIKNV